MFNTPDDESQYSEHAEHTFCYDMTCPCHEDKTLMDKIGEAVEDGFATREEADAVYHGRTV